MNLLHLEILEHLHWISFLIGFTERACGLSNPLDGSADNSITCFKSDGPIGERGLVVLREMRATSKGGDGHNEQSHIFDEEEGIGCDLNLDAIGEELDLFFDID
uniref:Candidate secreted effector n=1 Tax=Meloidogyne incognita TaxID=6306 RepID=A0A914NFN2_MELIC